MSMNAHLKIGSLSQTSTEFRDSLAALSQAGKETTAALRRGLARACGVGNGDIGAVKRDDITKEVIDDWFAQIVYGVADLPANEANQKAFQSAVRMAIPRILAKFGHSGSLKVAYHLPKGKGRSLEFVPQFSSECGEDDSPPWVIGLHWIAKASDPDEFGDRETFEPETDHIAQHGDETERQAREQQEVRDHEFAVGHAHNMLDQFLKETETDRDSAIAAGAILEALDSLPEIVSANLNLASDSQLIAELKSRGFRVSKIKAKA
jgi:hypothetical protein